MTRPEQIEEEWIIVRSLEAMLRDFPPGEIKRLDDPLDFGVRDGEGRYSVGIEVTEVGRGQTANGLPLASAESLQTRIVTECELAYKKIGGVPVYVSVHFTEPIDCKKREVPSLAEWIAGKVTAVAVPGMIDTDIDVAAERSCAIRKLTVRYFSTLAEVQFAPIRGGPWEELTRASLQEVVNSNENKVDVYRKQCDVVWLAIYINRFKLSASVELPLDIDFFTCTSGFDRVFLLDDHTKVVKIRVERSA